MAHFGSMRWLRRWSLIGNDYIWPWAVHQQARELVRSAAADVVHEEFVPFGSFNPERLLDAIRKSRAQAVLLSLVGRDLATFNRAFHRSPLGGRVIRISCALEETGLLEVGGDSTGELYAAMGWYSSDEQQSEFAAKYASRWGTVAPTLGVYARGCYEGIHALGSALDYDGPSNLRVRANWSAHGSSQRPSVQLARADGLILSIVNSQPADS